MTTKRQVEARPAAVPRASRLRFGFISEVYSELQKVVWPTREEATRLTILVIVVSLVVGVALGLIDIGFSNLIRQVFVG